MLYLYVHTHSAENCPADLAGAFMEKYGGPLRQDAEKAGIKIVANYVDPLEHKIYIVFDVPEGKDLLAMRESLMVWMRWGSAQMARVSSQPELNT